MLNHLLPVRHLPEKSMKTFKGIMIIPAIMIVGIFAILTIRANTIWDLEIKRELEQELIFRGKQYVYAIEKYNKKNNNIPLKDFDTLFEKRFIRRLYTEPLSEDGKWKIVMRKNQAGSRGGKLLIVPEELLSVYISKAKIIGVCSAADDVGYYEYRTKKNYNEWAFFVGAKEDKAMPEMEFVKE